MQVQIRKSEARAKSEVGGTRQGRQTKDRLNKEKRCDACNDHTIIDIDIDSSQQCFLMKALQPFLLPEENQDVV